MNEDAMKQVAYVQAMTACALLEGLGKLLGKLLDAYVATTTHTHSNQHELMARRTIEEYGIHHNAVIGALHNR